MDTSMEMVKVQEQVEALSTEHNPILPSVKRTNPIGVLRLNKRTKNMLNNTGVFTIRELISLTPSELIKHRNCGYITLLEIQSELVARGYKMKKDRKPK